MEMAAETCRVRPSSPGLPPAFSGLLPKGWATAQTNPSLGTAPPSEPPARPHVAAREPIRGHTK